MKKGARLVLPTLMTFSLSSVHGDALLHPCGRVHLLSSSAHSTVDAYADTEPLVLFYVMRMVNRMGSNGALGGPCLLLFHLMWPGPVYWLGSKGALGGRRLLLFYVMLHIWPLWCHRGAVLGRLYL
ncbi:hypothetical protein CBR_g8960 [Chara braunii]|uniref:Uncharacterized protein n=1 Tax=Chara braunii TaxID=69332 RepID=A0A388KNB5_CHABU|nr:hypothetical protein CBR_g8960 [Chara braunii]|eukprot:GBG71542.1 hypothetical protein CBR_g8960 [Chara braunii]